MSFDYTFLGEFLGLGLMSQFLETNPSYAGMQRTKNGYTYVHMAI
jgi:hypothetical protein